VDESLRILLVELPHLGRGIAKHLLANYDLDFDWVCAQSPQQLLKLADDFKPDIVLCCECTSGDTGHPHLETLRMLCSRAPSILVARLHEAPLPQMRNMTAALLADLRPSLGESGGSGGEIEAAANSQDLARLRYCFSYALESSTNPMVMSDSDGWITFGNTSACRMLGDSREHCVGTLLSGSLDSLKPVHWLDAARNSNLGNDQFSGPFSGSPADSRPPQIHRLAYFDAITGHPAPIHVNSMIDLIGLRSAGNRSALALVAANLRSARISDESCFYSVADGNPHAAAREEPPETPIYGSVVRITPHDYLLALPIPCSVAEAAFTAQRVLESIDAAQNRVTPCLAIPPAGRRAMPHSDVAVGEKLIAQSSSDSPAGDRARIELDLEDALRRNALSLQYQPQYEIGSGRGCGVEALVRWTLSSGEIVSPTKFIPVAEKTGLIHDLGAWVLRSACETAAAWGPRNAPLATLSVNVSALQIDERFSNVLVNALKLSGFPAKHLELEISESALIRNTALTIEYFREWKQLGIRIAVDDFGTGYSSLSHLSRLPIDRLKLDQSLIHRMTMDARGAAVIRSIVNLGAEIGVDVIAEGVETEEQFQLLSRLGCPMVQGYLLGRPMSAKQAQIVLRKSWGNRPEATSRDFPVPSIDAASHHVH